MSDKPKVIINEINNFIKNDKHYKEYEDAGFLIELNLLTFDLQVTYKRKKYIISLMKKNNQYLWRLTPYNHSYYETNIENGLSIVLFAIKENEELYS